MDFFFECVAELALKILEKVTARNISKRSQTIVDMIVIVILLLAVNGYTIWSAINYYRKGNLLGAIIFGSIVVLTLLLVGFITIRRIIRNRKNKIEP